MDHVKNIIEHARNYLNLGLRLIPLKDNSKIPNTGRWKNNYFRDIDEIIIWWKLNPQNNLGIITGSYNNKNLLVIDIDLKSGGYESIEQLPKLNPTMTISTCNGGLHYYYYTKSIFRNKQQLLSGIDLRGEGGYVVAPPSVINNSYDVKVGGINDFDEFSESGLLELTREIRKERVLILHNEKKKGGVGGKNELPPKLNKTLSRIIRCYPINNNRNIQQSKLIAKLLGQGHKKSIVFKLISKWLLVYVDNYKTSYAEAQVLLKKSLRSCSAAFNNNSLTTHTNESQHILNLKAIKTKKIKFIGSDRDIMFVTYLCKQSKYTNIDKTVKFTNAQVIDAFGLLFNKKLRANQLTIMKKRYISTTVQKASKEELLVEISKGVRGNNICEPTYYEITGLQKYL